ncbi:microfibril-associated glycoprotein 4 [Leptinotarsa decemlineata]|uniref:microfibril-associated glycoprotein 4 n=1 Tax=Leptinotarsa decemlineata TaxID=7539 RepID=UPI003D3087C2
MASLKSFQNVLLIMMMTGEILFGIHSTSKIDGNITRNSNNKKYTIKMDLEIDEGTEEDPSSPPKWIQEYCKSKVGISRVAFPCQLPLERKNKDLPRDCKEVQSRGYNTSGVYEIQPNKKRPSFMVLCDMEIKGGGWTHIHKRFDGSVDFYLRWREYKFGFGDLNGEFWIGLENMHVLTALDLDKTELLVEIVTRENEYGYAHYKDFKVGSEPDGYPLERLSVYSGDAGDSLDWHRGMKFTTQDVDQDKSDENCAVFAKGAYWYNNCFASNLNGELINHEVPGRVREGMSWDSWKNYEGRSKVLAKARMLIRSSVEQHQAANQPNEPAMLTLG